MLSFTAYKWGDAVFINKKKRYRSGEILCDYLNLDIKKLEQKWLSLIKHGPLLEIPYTKNDGVIDYNSRAHEIQGLLHYMDSVLLKLKPFCALDKTPSSKLYDLLNKYSFLFKVSEDEPLCISDSDIDYESSDDIDYEQFWEDKHNWRRGYRDFGGQDEVKEITNFTLSEVENENDVFIPDINKEIEYLLDQYKLFCEGVFRVHYVFTDFLDNFFHIHSTFPNPAQAAAAYQNYRDAYKEVQRHNYQRFAPISHRQIEYEVLQIKDAKSKKSLALCEVVRYDDIASFLTTELFDGIKTGMLPKRCGCCGKYFLLENNYYADFCENIAPGETEKTCRDIGARKKYDDKVKNDPIWQPYQRAYKTHYARYMKKKMTISEFEKWSREAIQLRDDMLAGKSKLSQAEYEAWLKK